MFLVPVPIWHITSQVSPSISILKLHAIPNSLALINDNRQYAMQPSIQIIVNNSTTLLPLLATTRCGNPTINVAQTARTEGRDSLETIAAMHHARTKFEFMYMPHNCCVISPFHDSLRAVSSNPCDIAMLKHDRIAEPAFIIGILPGPPNT
jgi:hypothetical protein